MIHQSLQKDSGQTQIRNFFYKIQTPPWEVPKKRKTRGRTQEFYYDLTNDNIIWKQCGEIATFNKFDLIDPEETRLKSTDPEDIYTSDKKTNDIPFIDFHEYNDFFAGDSVINESFHDFMGTRNKYMSSNKHFMYSNKKNKKYLKPLSNSISRYNNRYFDDMNLAYKVRKKNIAGIMK